MIFVIHTFRGGRGGGGVYIDEQHIYYGLTRSTEISIQRHYITLHKG